MITYKAVSAITSKTASLDVRLSEAGRIYYQVALRGNEPPTAEQLFAMEGVSGFVDMGSFVVDKAEVHRLPPLFAALELAHGRLCPVAALVRHLPNSSSGCAGRAVRRPEQPQGRS